MFSNRYPKYPSHQNGRKVLSFGAGYAHLVNARAKTTTVRLLGQRSYVYTPGECVVIHARSGIASIDVPGRIRTVTRKMFRDMTERDLEGESPDNATVNALKCTLGNIYKEEISPDTLVQVVTFEYEG